MTHRGVYHGLDSDSTFAICDILTPSGTPTDADTGTMSITLKDQAGATISSVTITPAVISGRTGGIRIPVDLSAAAFVAGSNYYLFLDYEISSSAGEPYVYALQVS